MAAIESLRPRLSGWRLVSREQELFASAKEIPTWTLADKCRRVLLDLCAQLWDRTPTPTVDHVDQLPAPEARRLAALHLGQVSVRASSAQMMLIATGYEREGFGQTRISLEALLRTRLVLDDRSGGSARTIIKGQQPRSLKAIAQRYGQTREIEILDRFAHADPLSLRPLGPPRVDGEREAVVEMRPERGRIRPAQQLLDASRTSIGQSVAMVEIFKFGVYIPPWIRAQFEHYRDHPLPDSL
jgi:hypothetical protein